MTHSNMTAQITLIQQHSGSLVLRALNWMVELDRRYRQAQQLKVTEACHLADMGISRQDIR